MIRATTRPRRSAGARSAAKGIITCPATEVVPTAMDASPKSQMSGARAQATRATAARAKMRDHQHPPWVEVAQRDHEQEPGGVADLGGGDDQGGHARAAVEVVCHQVQHRLGVVEVGHDGAGRHGDQGHQGA